MITLIVAYDFCFLKLIFFSFFKNKIKKVGTYHFILLIDI